MNATNDATVTEPSTSTQQEPIQTIAQRMMNRNVPVSLLHASTKLPLLNQWNSLCFTKDDPSLINEWADGKFDRFDTPGGKNNGWANGQYSDDKKNLAICCVCSTGVGNLVVLDIDAEGVRSQIETEIGETLDTFTVQSRPDSAPYKQHLYFWQTDYSVSHQPTTVNACSTAGRYDLKVNGQVVAPGCVHSKTGKLYTIQSDAPIKPIPDWLIDWIKADVINHAPKNATGENAKFVPLKEDQSLGDGERWPYLRQLSVKLRTAGLSAHTIFDTLVAYSDEHFGNYAHEGEHSSQIRKLADSASSKFQPDVYITFGKSSEEKEIEATDEAIKDMPDEVLDGWLGEVMQKRMSRFPVAFAWPSIVTVGGALVKRPEGECNPECNHIVIDGGVRTNLNTGLVGPVGSGKSTAIEQANLILGAKAPTLMEGKVGSGEGLIELMGEANGQSRIFSPDELSHTLSKANIEQSSLSRILTTAFYKDQDSNTIKGHSIHYHARLSVIGGLVDEQFGTAFGSESFGGLFDRFMFGIAPSDFQMNYRPPSTLKEEFSSKPVYVSPDVWERLDEWKKQNPGISPRVAEIALRVAYIAACYSKKSILTAKDLDPALAFAEYQKNARLILQPNGGELYTAKMEAAIRNVLQRAKGWLSESNLKTRVHIYRTKFGVRVYEDAIKNLIHDKAILVDIGSNGKGLRYRIGGQL